MDPVRYEHEEGVATITLDDGKVNVLSPDMLRAIHRALDRAEADGAVVLLRGRPGRFSGGFDLPLLQSGAPEGIAMVRDGFVLAERLLALPLPVVTACTGHAVAMGLFLLLCGDQIVGIEGDYKLIANEVAIGLTLPFAAIEIVRHRLTPAAAHRAIVLSEAFPPASAVPRPSRPRPPCPPGSSISWSRPTTSTPCPARWP
jgi:enoyl-CoA hydratase